MRQSWVARRSLATAITLGVVSAPGLSRAEWSSDPSGVRYWLPPSWTTRALEGGTLARGASGVALWVLPLNGSQLASASTPEALLSSALRRPRVSSRTTSLSPLLPTGRWSQGSATFEGRAVRWWARAVRLDANRGALAAAISSRSTLSTTDAELLETALNSAHLGDAPGVTRYVGTGSITSSVRAARSVTSPLILELRGTGEHRAVVIPDLDDNGCTFQGRVRDSGSLRLDADQACQLSRLQWTTVLTGGQLEFAGSSASFSASGRMSVMTRMRQGPMIVGAWSFNWQAH